MSGVDEHCHSTDAPRGRRQSCRAHDGARVSLNRGRNPPALRPHHQSSGCEPVRRACTLETSWLDGFTFRPAHLLECDARAEISGLVVGGNRARGTGVGRRLVEAAEEWALRAGASRVMAGPLNQRRTEARGFYEHLGYKLAENTKRLQEDASVAL